MSLVLILANERERCGEHDPAFLLDARGETLGIRGVPHGNHVAFAAIGECASFEREARASAAHFDFDQIAALDILRLLDLECGDRGRGLDGLAWQLSYDFVEREWHQLAGGRGVILLYAHLAPIDRPACGEIFGRDDPDRAHKNPGPGPDSKPAIAAILHHTTPQ